LIYLKITLKKIVSNLHLEEGRVIEELKVFMRCNGLQSDNGWFSYTH
jgi:hypothetical protein